jgi:hypothetical protein
LTPPNANLCKPISTLRILASRIPKSNGPTEMKVSKNIDALGKMLKADTLKREDVRPDKKKKGEAYRASSFFFPINSA